MRNSFIFGGGRHSGRTLDNALEQSIANDREAHELLALIEAEFSSDPMSVQCFDARLVERVKRSVATRRETQKILGEV